MYMHISNIKNNALGKYGFNATNAWRTANTLNANKHPYNFVLSYRRTALCYKHNVLAHYYSGAR